MDTEKIAVPAVPGASLCHRYTRHPTQSPGGGDYLGLQVGKRRLGWVQVTQLKQSAPFPTHCLHTPGPLPLGQVLQGTPAPTSYWVQHKGRWQEGALAGRGLEKERLDSPLSVPWTGLLPAPTVPGLQQCHPLLLLSGCLIVTHLVFFCQCCSTGS